MGFDAVVLLTLSPIKNKKILNEAGISADLQAFLRPKQYRPFLKTGLNSKLDTFEEENQQTDISREALKYYIKQQNSFYSKLPMLDLNLDDNVLLEEEIEFLRNPPRSKKKIKEEFIGRMTKATGGLVEGKDDVPYTKENPADRVDPFTGQPYSAQMGELGLNVFQER